MKTNFVKMLALLLSFIIAAPTGAFAQNAAAPAMQEEEVERLLSSTDRHAGMDIYDIALWGLAVSAVGRVVYKAGYFVGDIKGFGRGYLGHASSSYGTTAQVKPQAAAKSAEKVVTKESAALERELSAIDLKIAEREASLETAKKSRYALIMSNEDVVNKFSAYTSAQNERINLEKQIKELERTIDFGPEASKNTARTNLTKLDGPYAAAQKKEASLRKEFKAIVKERSPQNHFMGEEIALNKELSALKSARKSLAVQLEASTSTNAVTRDLFNEFNILKSQFVQLQKASKTPSSVIDMILAIDKNLAKIATTNNKAELIRLRSEVTMLMERLSSAKINNPSLSKAIQNYITRSYRRMGANSNLLGLAVVGLAGTAVMLLGSTEASAQTISNDRVLVAREIKVTAESAPDLLLSKVLLLKARFGAKLVSSVVYENQAEVMPALAKQIAFAQDANIRKEAAALLESLKKDDAAARQAELSGSLKNKSALDNFVESMKNSSGRAFLH